MKWHAAPSARCAEHGLTLGKDGRCALCKRSTGRAARRSGWAAALAVACVLAGAALVGARIVVKASADAGARAPAAALRAPPRRPSPVAARTPPETARSGRSAAPEPGEAAPFQPNAAAAGASPGPNPVSAEERGLGAPMVVPPAARRAAPVAPEAPQPPIDPDNVPARDDPRDFERPAPPAQSAAWAPSL
jgi:hypothetical protein